MPRRSMGARSEERGARSEERGARSEERGARSEERGARSEELKFLGLARSQLGFLGESTDLERGEARKIFPRKLDGKREIRQLRHFQPVVSSSCPASSCARPAWPGS